MTLLFKIWFLEMHWVDLVDITLVAILLFQLFRLVRGSLAFNILIGLLLVYFASVLVRTLNMQLLSRILGNFVDVGVLAVLIVFQPEIRRFLLYLGQSSRFGGGGFLKGFSLRQISISRQKSIQVHEIIQALHAMSRNRTGGIIVCAVASKLQSFADTGVTLNARISKELLESIFFKNNPLHDGAVIIANGVIKAARCILPISENSNLPHYYGLRHRSAIGITEQSNAVAFVVSEETGQISYARHGDLVEDPSDAEIEKLLLSIFSRQVQMPQMA